MSVSDKDKVCLVNGKYSIEDLVDLEQLKGLFEKFTDATGFTIGFLNHPDLNVLIGTGWRDICTKFHRGCPTSNAICIKSNRHLLDQLDTPGKLVIEACENGLVDCATPIIIQGKHIASLATGQLLLEEPNLERFKEQARRFGFDETEYLNALKEIPVVDAGRLKMVTRFLGDLAQVISELGYTKLMVIEDARQMMTEITERKHAEDAKAKLENQLQQAHRMESVGRLAGGVAHDFNNMLGVIIGRADVAIAQLELNHPVRAHLEEIQKAASRSIDLTRQLLGFARKQTIAPKLLDLNESISGMLKMLQRLIGEDLHLSWHPKPELWLVNFDTSQIDQILTNLCVNARDAIADIGTITIETENVTVDSEYCISHAEFAPGDYVKLTVCDTGCGIDKETLSHIFEPFFTTKKTGRNTGLGLSMVYGIVKQNNGFIKVTSELGHGTSFTIYLPRYTGKNQKTEQPQTPEKRVFSGHETILLVEDEQAVLEMITDMLGSQGYTVLAANTPEEAIRIAEAQGDKVDLIITDVVMPGMNGRNLAKKLQDIYPQLKCLFMSGYTANVIAQHGVLDEGVNFIQKPFSTNDLAHKIRTTLDNQK
ncbi:MAG: hypothetical protein A2X49_04515 [Lentisphaerae bacterium GWF2_52_8]|nr:MAG: hypothetical protein A2X49_04515 [Lentisphaerae bacterium GWF2_52_8]